MSTTQIKLRRDTMANWVAQNPVLELGEPGLEIDSLRVKYGDGTTKWNDLAYPSYVGPIGPQGLGWKPVPISSAGQMGDTVGDTAIDDTYLYYCTAPFGTAATIWKRQPLNGVYW